MSFNADKKTANKNMFTARLVSKKTGNMAAWIHVTDALARSVFGVMKSSEITAEDASKVLPAMFETAAFDVVITDLTADLTPIDALEF